MQSNRKFKLLIAIVFGQICFLVVGCSMISNTAGSSLPTGVALPTMTPLPEWGQPTYTPTGAIPTATSIATEELAATPNGSSFVRTVRKSNGDCRLPCWWGIVPGETDWDAATAFLAPYSLDIAPFERDGYTYYTAYIEQGAERPLTNDFAVWDSKVQLISALGETGSSFTPAAVLKKYGLPDQIWIQTGNSPFGSVGFVTVLVYKQQGFLVHYGSLGTQDGEEVVSCISNEGNSLRLLAWDPDLNLSYEDAMAIGMSTSPTTYDIPLEEATGKTLEEFYEEYSVEGAEVCLRTPQNLWPGP